MGINGVGSGGGDNGIRDIGGRISGSGAGEGADSGNDVGVKVSTVGEGAGEVAGEAREMGSGNKTGSMRLSKMRGVIGLDKRPTRELGLDAGTVGVDGGAG